MNIFLTQTAEYALRVMTVVAQHDPEESLLTRDLSNESGIPGQYLSKILRRLVLAGLLESRKGRGGGFRLARPAGRISFREVLSAVDAFPLEDRCAFGWGRCDPSNACPLHAAWTGMSAHFQRWASSSTFAVVREPVARTTRARPALKRPARSPKPSRTRSAVRKRVR